MHVLCTQRRLEKLSRVRACTYVVSYAYAPALSDLPSCRACEAAELPAQLPGLDHLLLIAAK
jgi:hypothetical protein